MKVFACFTFAFLLLFAIWSVLPAAAQTVTTGTVVGSFIPFWQARVKAYEAWLQDPNTGVKPKLFATRIIEHLQRSIEAEELRDAEDDE